MSNIGTLFAAFILSVAFNMGTDTVTILQNPIGQPMATVRLALLFPVHSSWLNLAQIIFNSLGMKGTLAVWSLIIITMYVCFLGLVIFVLKNVVNSNMSSMNVVCTVHDQIYADEPLTL